MMDSGGHSRLGMCAAVWTPSVALDEVPDAPRPGPSRGLGSATASGRGATPTLDFEAVYAEHFGFVWRAVRGLGVSTASIDDVTQEVFLVVHRRLSTLEDPAALKSWLFGIARRVTKDHRRALGRRGEAVELDPERAAGPAGDPERAHAEQEAIQAVAAYASGLDEERRALFFLALVEGMPILEAADMLGVNPNTTYSRVRAMRRELAALLGIASDEGDSHGRP